VGKVEEPTIFPDTAFRIRLKQEVARSDWVALLPHTTRAALTGLRKRGFAIQRTREEGSDSIYWIVSAPAAAAA
jgi:hypothetical protein